MSFRTGLIFVGFLFWSLGSVWFYTCKIKQQCAMDSIESDLVTNSDVSIDSSLVISGKEIKVDTSLTNESSVIETDTLATLYFKKNETHFEDNPEIDSYLVKIASKLGVKSKLQIEVYGHTDDQGKEEFNQKLSLKRAEDVKLYLVKNGAIESKIKTFGMGESQPLFPDTSEVSRDKNRRVEIKFN